MSPGTLTKLATAATALLLTLTGCYPDDRKPPPNPFIPFNSLLFHFTASDSRTDAIVPAVGHITIDLVLPAPDLIVDPPLFPVNLPNQPLPYTYSVDVENAPDIILTATLTVTAPRYTRIECWVENQATRLQLNDDYANEGTADIYADVPADGTGSATVTCTYQGPLP